ncbi:DUF1877 family protein [Nostoc punctiforme FACHB-252]|uniref:DUF1877 family protein n=1 Tax=Nostoc punctiforme FACHB-252 TaxID=1357509 RepID=A0ABR8H3S2_NOSPU|nr:DUF1877 family protein [Nostoc punctiforme]MBD2609891.1 DUF1877 family protein [Nostoc punctiforme FACHB-252]
MNAYLVRVYREDGEKIISSSKTVENVIKQAQNQSDRVLDLDESWYGIHFVMTAEYPIPKDEAQRRGISWNNESLENVILGGSPTPYKTMFGAARYLNPEEVAQMAEKLNNLTVDKFKEWCDPETLIEEQIPPVNWDENSTLCDWLSDYFKKLLELYKSAASVGDGILVYII